uniref:Ribonuclease H-like domain-containing protein n=1 Tax=Tanacetum cinerariifolium TaxID=118510 RepID=A0A6L2KE47_TANCI|nr:ribonuclease H-like domain-containing protein [Tanacetum cinerariifolium]
MVAAAKLPVLNPNEFKLWKMRIERYFLMTDYALWKVILNGELPPPTRSIEGVETPYPLIIIEEKLARKNELKVRGTLLVALPNEHQLYFNSYKTTKSLMEAIEKRFGEGLDQIYDRLQKLISQLEIHRETISQEDMKLLRSFLSEWKTHTLIWRNKPDLETLSMDDLYNNLKIYEAKVTGSSSTTQNTQNIAFVSSNNSDNTNKAVNIAHGISTASFKTNASNLPNVDSLRYRLKVIDKNVDYESQKIPIENRKECRAFKHEDNRNIEAPKSTAEDGRTSFALMAYTSSSSLSSLNSDTEFNLEAYKAGLESVEARLEVYKKNETIFEDDIKSLKLDVMFRDKAITELKQKFKKAENKRDDLKLTLEKFLGSSKNLSRLLDSQQSDKSKTGLGYDSQGLDSQVESVTSVPGIAKSKVKTSETKLKNGNLQYTLKDQRIFDSGCSRHMTGNKSFLTDNQENDGGFVAFGGSPKGGKISRKVKIRTGKLDFEDVYFVKELKFNLFSVFQMCDKKNNVLFTKTECLVLSPDFKLLDEKQVLLKVP